MQQHGSKGTQINSQTDVSQACYAVSTLQSMLLLSGAQQAEQAHCYTPSNLTAERSQSNWQAINISAQDACRQLWQQSKQRQ